MSLKQVFGKPLYDGGIRADTLLDDSLQEAFDPNEKRDESGKWTSGSDKGKELRDSLIKGMNEDQKLRSERKPNWKIIKQVDEKNTEQLKKIIEEIGWPGKSLVGKNASYAAWLIAQHADRDPIFQKRCLDLVKEAYQSNEVTGSQLAYLTDRVRLNNGKKQLYGTQYQKKDDKWLLRPVEDLDNLDNRRAELGLRPWRSEFQEAVSGTFTDKRGHRYKLVNGVRVKLNSAVAVKPQHPKGMKAFLAGSPKKIKSSYLAAAKYDVHSNTLRLAFNSQPGVWHKFGNVSPVEARSFWASESKGKWFHANIKGKGAKKGEFLRSYDGKEEPPFEEESFDAHPHHQALKLPNEGKDFKPNKKFPGQARPKLTAREARAIKWYTTGNAKKNYALMNSHLRKNNGKYMSKFQRKMYERIRSAIAKTGVFDKPIQTYRGLYFPDTHYNQKRTKELILKFKKARASGRVIRSKGFTSVTSDLQTGMEFLIGYGHADPGEASVFMEIKANKGLDASPYSIDQKALPSTEKELILDCNTRFKVLEVEEKKGEHGAFYKVKLEQV